jgi:hypothetical protein
MIHGKPNALGAQVFFMKLSSWYKLTIWWFPARRTYRTVSESPPALQSLFALHLLTFNRR